MVLLRELESNFVRNLERVLNDVRSLGKEFPHLLTTLEVEAFVVPHPVAVSEVLPKPDAEQDVVGVVVLATQEVRIVGGNDRKAELLRQGEHARIQVALPR